MNFRNNVVIATLKNCQSLAQVHYTETVPNDAALSMVLLYSSQCVSISKTHNHSLNFLDVSYTEYYANLLEYCSI